MVQLKLRLHLRIIFGYLIMVVVIGSMITILINERHRVRNIEQSSKEINLVRDKIHSIHRNITELSILGESFIGWNEDDYQSYHSKRILTDSLLHTMKPICSEYINLEQIDSLSHLLSVKESHLLYILETLERQEKTDSLLVNHLPEIAKRATRVRTVKRKKTGIAGFFGGKKTIQILPSAKELHAFSDSLVTQQKIQSAEMDAYIDSLRIRNQALNIQLNRLVSDLDTQAQTAFGHRERKIAEAQMLSVRLFTITYPSPSSCCFCRTSPSIGK